MATDSATAPQVWATIYRKIERDEQTNDDNSIIRIEAGRSIKGTYYTKEGTSINFTTELQGAMSGLVSSVGLLIATSVVLLSF